MVPVNSNTSNKKCGGGISSNCVNWDGPAIEGVCKGGSVTDVITRLAENADCCSGTFPTGNQSCYTGSWVNMVSGIPLSGTTGGISWGIGTFGVGNTGNPSYKWAKDGDLSLKGGFVLTLTPPPTDKTYFDIPLFSIPTTCFPSNWNNNQGIVTFVDFFSNGQQPVGVRCVVYIDYPTGILYLNTTFINIPLIGLRLEIDLGGVRFNLA